MQVSVVIPALNEGESLGQVLSDIPSGCVSEVVVVDGGSTDNTVSVARAGGAHVVNENRRGYGRACATGSINANGDILVFLDADGADDPRQIPDLISPILNGRAEMVLGSRLRGNISPGAMPKHQRFGNWFSAKLIHLLYGLPLSDLSPFRAVVRKKLAELEMQDMTYGWPTEMIVKAVRSGWSIEEIPVNYHSRLGGESKISGTIRGTVLATIHILTTILRYWIVPPDTP